MNVVKIIHDEYRGQRDLPFVWGKDDCLTFAAACAAPVIGRDPIAHLRGRYATAGQALEVMAAEGWDSMGDVVASMFAEIPVASAQNGDWAIILNATGTETVGVFCGSMIAAKLQAGVGQVPRNRATRAFRVE